MVFVFLSHALTFSMLFVASLFDLDTTDVPDIFCATAVVGGIMLHFLASRPLQPEIILSYISVNGLSAMASIQGLATIAAGIGEPLFYSLVTGLIFSVLGWTAYFRGMWGGADAFALSALGFGAPYAGTASILGPLNLFVNIAIAGFIYVMGFTLYKSYQHPEVYRKTLESLKEEKRRVGLELAALGVFSVFLHFQQMPALIFSGIFVFMVILSRFLEVVQDEAFYRTVSSEELEPGDVAAPGQGFGEKIVGLTEEDIEEIDEEEFEIREGVPFMPVFVLALLLTDLFGAGFLFIAGIF